MAGISTFSMNRVGNANSGGATWHYSQTTSYTERIPWRVLRDEAKKAYQWLLQQGEQAWTQPGGDDGALLAAALFMPGIHGGAIYYSSICRGQKADEMKNVNTARRIAPAWLKANDDRPNQTHCEDGACFDFEAYNNNLYEDDPDKIRVTQHGYLPQTSSGRALEPQIAVFGVRTRKYAPIAGLQQPCREGESSRPKVPVCQVVLPRLRVRVCTSDKIRAEEDEEARRAQAARNAGPGGGAGAGGAGQGHGAGGGAGYGGGHGGGRGGGAYPGGGHSGGTTRGGSDPAADLSGMMTNMKIGSKVDWKQDSKGDWYYKDKRGDRVYDNPQPKKSSTTQPKKSSSKPDWKQDSKGDWYYKDTQGNRVYDNPQPKKSSTTQPKKSSSSIDWKQDSRGDWYYKDRNNNRVYRQAA